MRAFLTCLVENVTVAKNRFLQYLPIVRSRYSIRRIVVFQLVDARGQRVRSRGKERKKGERASRNRSNDISDVEMCQET